MVRYCIRFEILGFLGVTEILCVDLDEERKAPNKTLADGISRGFRSDKKNLKQEQFLKIHPFLDIW